MLPGARRRRLMDRKMPGSHHVVLILQVAPGAELVDAHGDRILSGVHAVGDVKLVGEARTAGHAHPRAVDPHARLAFDAVEAQGNQVILPPVGQLEGAVVVAGQGSPSGG